jgi:uncharacterized protein YfdQ (DUF2303 family)
MDNPTQKPAPNHIQSAIEAGRNTAPRVYTSPIQDGRPFVVLRDGDGNERAIPLEETIDSPPRKIGTVKLDDAESFIAYWETHNEPSSAIYASMKGPTFTAIFDEHGPSEPKYRGHRAIFAPQFSPEYKTWIGSNGKENAFAGNEELALWIEDQLPDFVMPAGNEMLTMALNFKVVQNAGFGKAIRLQDGKTAFSYTNDVQGSSDHESGSLQIPDQFTINIPIYSGMQARKYAFQARFRYRLNGGRLSLWYELIRPHKVVEVAFAELVASVNEATKKTVLFGSPE